MYIPQRIPSELTINENPSWTLFKKMEEDVQDVRSTLLKELEGISPLVALASKEILEKKLENTNSPLMGELFPWMIQDITNMDKVTIKKIAVGWLAIYIYTIFLDRHLDSDTKISPKEFLAGSILAKKGLLSLHSIVTGTKYEKIFNESLNLSAIGQLQDAIETSRLEFDGNIEEIAIKKNSLLIACASAMAVNNSKDADLIFDFTNSFLLILQYLDDLGDWEEDLNERHTTTLLAKVSSHLNNNSTLFDLDHNQVLEKMIYTGTLRMVVSRIQELLKTMTNRISPLTPISSNSYSFYFIDQLAHKMENFQSQLVVAESVIDKMTIHERLVLITGIKRDIRIIAQSS